MKKTKIIATISDRNCDIEFINSLWKEGMDIVRLNTAHQSRLDALKVINNVRAVSDRIAILVDTKGPEIRTTSSDGEFRVTSGQKIFVEAKPDKKTTAESISVSYKEIVEEVKIGTKILIDDGTVELVVLEKQGDKLLCEVRNNGFVDGHKSVNIPSVHIKLPSLSEKDKEFINFAIENNLDFIAHSFVRDKEDIIAIKNILNERNSKIKIIAKIENFQGVENIDEIIDYSDGIMIARGDLAVEVPQEQIPIIQKQIIKKCINKRKPVITATQMLHSMIRNPRPTRAEISDVANAIYDGTDAIMLSGETASGQYPIESVKTMTSIAIETEKNKKPYKNIPVDFNSKHAISRFLCKCAVDSTITIDTKAIVADSVTGRIIKNLSAFRGRKIIFAITYDEVIMRQLNILFGVYPMIAENENNFISKSIQELLEKKLIEVDDNIVRVGGSFEKQRGATFIEIKKAKELV